MDDNTSTAVVEHTLTADPVRDDRQSADIAKLAAALVKAQSLIRSAKKDGKNPHFGSRYSTLAEVWDVIREPLTSNGLSVIQIPQPTQGQTVSLVTMLVHESGQYIKSEISMPLRPEFLKSGVELPPSPQQVGSCITYARRYSISSMVGVASDDDDDGNQASREPPETAKAPSAAKPPLKNKWGSAYPNEAGSEGKPSPPAQAEAKPEAKPAAKAPPAPKPEPAKPSATQVQDPTAFHARLYEACQAAGITPGQLEADLKAKGILKGQMCLDNLGQPIVTALLEGKDRTSGRPNWDIVVERVKANRDVPY